LSVTCGRSVVFSGYSYFPHQYNWPPQYNWNTVESGIKHHNPNPVKYFSQRIYTDCVLVKNDMDINKHERLFNITLRRKFMNSGFIAHSAFQWQYSDKKITLISSLQKFVLIWPLVGWSTFKIMCNTPNLDPCHDDSTLY
jgi:hypothetical protein